MWNRNSFGHLSPLWWLISGRESGTVLFYLRVATREKLNSFRSFHFPSSPGPWTQCSPFNTSFLCCCSVEFLSSVIYLLCWGREIINDFDLPLNFDKCRRHQV